MQPKISLVTGGAGFIGSNLVDELAKDQSNKVIVVDNFDDFLYPSRLRRKWAKEISHMYSNVEVRDIPYEDLEADDFAEIDVIFNCAAIAGLTPSFDNPSKYISVNQDGFQSFLATLRASTFRGKLIHLSTSSVYGKYATGSENTAPAPISPYGETKLASEEALQIFQAQTGLPVVCARLFSVYGPRQRDDMAFSIFIRSIQQNKKIRVFGDGSQRRSNTYVKDVVTALNLLAGLDFPNYEVFNVAGRESIAIGDAIRIIGELLETAPQIEYFPVREGDQRETMGDTSKLSEITGWFPMTEISEGLRNQIRSYLRENSRGSVNAEDFLASDETGDS